MEQKNSLGTVIMKTLTLVFNSNYKVTLTIGHANKDAHGKYYWFYLLSHFYWNGGHPKKDRASEVACNWFMLFFAFTFWNEKQITYL
jgi:hypothetical protein